MTACRWRDRAGVTAHCSTHPPQLQLSIEQSEFDFSVEDEGLDEDGERLLLLCPLNDEAREWLRNALRDQDMDVPDELAAREEGGIVAGWAFMFLIATAAMIEGWRIDA